MYWPGALGLTETTEKIKCVELDLELSQSPQQVAPALKPGHSCGKQGVPGGWAESDSLNAASWWKAPKTPQRKPDRTQIATN